MTSESPGVRVRRVAPHEWRSLRSIRLAALQDSPYAFASTYEREAAWDDDAWRRSFGRVAWFLAWDGDEPVGVAAGLPEEGAPPDERHVISLWVAPHRRRCGVATALYRAVADWGRREGARSLVLWVTEGNEAAHRMYRKLGFVPTGERQPLPSDPSRWEQKLRTGPSV
jgi:ribosomal protein S18 acetylase RimI-like enzyme